MYVIVTGGRDYHLTEEGYGWLSSLDVTHVRCGGATGADTCAERWADQQGIPFQIYRVTPLDWRIHGKAAGPIRNAVMLEALLQDQARGEDIAVLVFPGGRGTEDCCRQATRLGIPVLRFRPDEETDPYA